MAEKENKNVFGKFIKALEMLLKAVILVLAVVMLFVGLYQVIGRYVLKISTPWTEELLRYLYVLLTYGACGLCVKQGSYIAITVISDRIAAIGKKTKIGVTTFILLFELAFFAIIIVYGSQMAAGNMNSFSTANNICQGVMYMIFPFAGITGALFSINEYFLFLKKTVGGEGK